MGGEPENWSRWLQWMSGQSFRPSDPKKRGDAGEILFSFAESPGNGQYVRLLTPRVLFPNFGLCEQGGRQVQYGVKSRGAGPTHGVFTPAYYVTYYARRFRSARHEQRVRGSEPRGEKAHHLHRINGERTVKGCRRREPGPRSLALTQHASDDQRDSSRKGRYASYRRCRRHRSSTPSRPALTARADCTRPCVIQCRARVDARGWAATSRGPLFNNASTLEDGLQRLDARYSTTRRRSRMGCNVSTPNGMTNSEPASDAVRGSSPPKRPRQPVLPAVS